MKHKYKKIVLSIITLLAAGVSPNLFVISQAGYAQLSDLAVSFLIPSVAVLILVFLISYFRGLKDFSIQIRNGLLAGLIGTLGLEIVRETGFHLGGMPGDMPKLLGVLLLNQFALGPDTLSNIAGWSYHFWNGASFGIIYSVMFGRGQKLWGIIYALLIGVGFMMSPAVVAMGVGHFGVNFGIGFPITVLLAHLAFGSLLGWVVFKWNKEGMSIFSTIRNLLNMK
jgi:hypothetical protein